jgi:hypothetical protein
MGEPLQHPLLARGPAPVWQASRRDWVGKSGGVSRIYLNAEGKADDGASMLFVLIVGGVCHVVA